jgi:hypothetical protein
VKGKLRTAAEAIHAAMGGDDVLGMSFGRRSAGEHVVAPFIKFIPIGGPITRPKRTAGKTVAGSAGMIVPNPPDNPGKITQPNVDERHFESLQRETRMLALILSPDGEDEADGIDKAEDLLERFVNAAHEAYPNEVTMSERWIVQDEERAGLGVAGECVAVNLDFMFPVIREKRPLIRVGGFSQTCKLNDTLEDESEP